jgi:hypothetical protein
VCITSQVVPQADFQHAMQAHSCARGGGGESLGRLSKLSVSMPCSLKVAGEGINIYDEDRVRLTHCSNTLKLLQRQCGHRYARPALLKGVGSRTAVPRVP